MQERVYASLIPREIWVLGLVSMLMDISSEMIHSLLPVFMVSVLGASVFAVGVFEGIAEATALIVRVFSGMLSDFLGKRKPLAVVGYGLGALSKPLFAVAAGLGLVFTARITDRIGKGIRGAPRDALIADLAPPELRGASFGLRQSLDTLGAFLGPLFAILLMLLWVGDFRAVFWIAVIPAVMAVVLLVVGVQEPERTSANKHGKAPIRWASLKAMSSAYWWVVGVGAVFTLARFSEAFLVLRADQVGVPASLVPLVMVVMNIVYALTAYPAGKLADRMSHGKLLSYGLIALIAADIILAEADRIPLVFAGVALWGLHMGLTQGLLAAMVAHTAPANLRGTAFGFFNLASGVAMLIASALAGFLWDWLGSSATFYAGVVFVLAALILLLREPVTDRRLRSPQ